MSRMTLLELKLTNFKGIKNFTLKTDGLNVKIFGDNATGKTTIFDAFIWLLFDKDSQNKKDFEIKTLSEGAPLHNLNHEVEGVFNLNGKELVLKKVYAEKWSKKRGSSQTEFTGHTTDYFIDEVPSKKKEYLDLISSIVDEDVFKLLTSPNYFNEQITWQKRRETLLEVCGNITDLEVIENDNNLAKLADFLRNRSIEDHKKVVLAKRKEINQELDRIPVRIDEASRSIPEITELNKGDLGQELSYLQSQLEDKEAELMRIKSGGEISAKENQLRELNSELLDIKNKLNAETIDKVNEKRQELYRYQSYADNLKTSISNDERKIKQNEIDIKLSEEKADDLRNQWTEVHQESFRFEDHQTTCPSCGQNLPEERLDEARSKAEAHFNLEKSKRLEWIQQEGKKEMNTVNELTLRNQNLQIGLNGSKDNLQKYENQIDEVQKEIEILQSSVKAVESDASYQAKQKEAESIKEQIQELRSSVFESMEKVRQEIVQLKAEISEVNKDLAKFSLVDQANNRIEELKSQQKDLSREFEKLEEELFLCEEFTRAKVNLLEEKINSKFKFARFKLFSEQINGGLQETCETLYEGVPYSGGLNNAARINVGLDIINTLSEHYGFSAPIFIDNSEAVTKFIEVESQVVSLVVSEKDKKLRVETDPEYLKEAI